jgi:hypothetical protein
MSSVRKRKRRWALGKIVHAKQATMLDESPTNLTTPEKGSGLSIVPICGLRWSLAVSCATLIAE